MAADPKRLAEALAYRQRLAQFVPQPAGTTPERPQAQSTRSQLENLSIGLGEGLTNQLEGVKGVITDPVGTAKGTYEAVRGVVRDPSVLADALRYTADKAMSGPLGAGEVMGEMLGPMRGRPAPDMLELDVYHGTPHRFPATETVNVYRGENAANMGGNYWSTDPEFAQQFTQRGLPEEVKRSTLSMSDVYSPPTPVFAGDAKAVDAAIAEARKLGKSAVRFSEGKGQPDSFFVIEKAALGRKGNPLGEFDASKIGTGEGAQAYGHGTYLAEAEGTGKGYQKRLSGSTYRDAKTGQLVESGNAWQSATKAVQDSGIGHPDRAGQIASQIQDWVDSGRTARSFLLNKRVPKEMEPAYEAAINSFENLRLNKGTLYKADLPDEMIDRMLDWDKPLSEQPALVKQLEASGFLKQAPAPFSNRYTGPTGTLIDLDSPGGNLVMGSGWNQKTSAALRDAGIPGIKYLDAGSRGQGGSGTRNFVVFPGEEKKVKILRRE